LKTLKLKLGEVVMLHAMTCVVILMIQSQPNTRTHYPLVIGTRSATCVEGVTELFAFAAPF
jgi:hypothetical protein